MVVGLECCNGPPSFTGDSVATGRATHVRQIGGKKTEEEATHWSSRIAGGWVYGRQPYLVKYKLFQNPKRKEIGRHDPNTVINVLGKRYKEICIINRYATSQSFSFKLRVTAILSS
jgi:hypothetical protein